MCARRPDDENAHESSGDARRKARRDSLRAADFGDSGTKERPPRTRRKVVAKSTDPETERYITEAAEGAILASAMAAKREKSHAHAHAHHAHGQHARAGSSNSGGGLADLDASLAARAAANKWAAADGVLESISRAVMAPMTDPISSAPPSPRAQLEFMAAIARQGGPAEGKRAFVALLQRRGDLLDELAEALYKTAEDIASALPAGNAPASAPPAAVPPSAAAAATVSAAARLPRPSATVAGATTVSGASSAGSTATAARRWSRPAPAEPPAAAPSRGSVAARWNGGGGAAAAQPTPAAAQPGRGSVMARWGGGAGGAATQPPPAQPAAAQPPRGSVMAKAGAFGATAPAAAAPRTSTSGGRSWAPVRKASLTKSTPASEAPASGKAKGAGGVKARLAMFEGK